jgi:hypothetical protein
VLRVIFLAWLALQFFVGTRHGLPNAIMWTILNAVVLLLLYGVYRLIARLIGRSRAPRAGSTPSPL